MKGVRGRDTFIFYMVSAIHFNTGPMFLNGKGY